MSMDAEPVGSEHLASRASEAHPDGYAYGARFPTLRPYAGAEGGGVYVADTPDGYYVVTDEGTLADFLEPDDPVIFVRAFDTAADRDAYCARRYGHLRADP